MKKLKINLKLARTKTEQRNKSRKVSKQSIEYIFYEFPSKAYEWFCFEKVSWDERLQITQLKARPYSCIKYVPEQTLHNIVMLPPLLDCFKTFKKPRKQQPR